MEFTYFADKMKIFLFKHKKLITKIGIAFLLVGLLLGLPINTNRNLIEYLLPAIATLFAAFLGAWYAFKLQNQREEEKKGKENIVAGNRALFLLARFANELKRIQQQHIDPVREDPKKFILMQPLILPKYDDLKFDFESLSFILETDFLQILGNLVAEELRFHQVIQAINYRSDLHLTQAQPRLERAEAKGDILYSVDQIRSALGELLYVQLEKTTEEIIKYVEQTLVSTERLSKKFSEILKKLFPGSKILSLDIKTEPNNSL